MKDISHHTRSVTGRFSCFTGRDQTLKILHLSDLHLGKRLNGFSLLEDQEYILQQILCIVREEEPQAVIIAGDVYDRPVPPAEAVRLLDDFLVSLSETGAAVMMISGNHDSADRLSFGGRLLARSGVYLAGTYSGETQSVTLQDAFGPVNFYLLPFIRPADVRRYYPEAPAGSYTEAVRTAVEAMGIDSSKRNVLAAHQFVTGAVAGDSEEISVGGLDNVDGAVFDCFDYTALGHIHGPQEIGSERLRYCGTPLKYSFSEAYQEKSVTVVELFEKKPGEKCRLSICTRPLKPLRDLVEIRGLYDDLVSKAFYSRLHTDDYYHITLTDEEDILDAMSRMRTIYKNIMLLDYDNTRTRASGELTAAADMEQKTPAELFAEFYEQVNGQAMSEAQQEFAEQMIRRIWEGEA